MYLSLQPYGFLVSIKRYHQARVYVFPRTFPCWIVMSPRKRTAPSGGQRLRRYQTAVKAQAVVDHSLRGEALAGARVCHLCIGTAHGTVGIKLSNILREAGRIIGAEIESRISPDFAEARNVIGHDGAPRKGRFQNGHSKRLVSGSGSVDRG